MLEFKKRGEEYWKDLSDNQILQRTQEFIDLYLKIKKNGWKESPPIWGNINEDGTLRIKGGYHRLSILNHLGYKKINVDLNFHSNFKKFFDIINKKYQNNRLYQSIDHLIFRDWSVVRGYNRGEIIKNNISPSSTILDLGSYVGAISHQLAIGDHIVEGVEITKELVYCAELLTRYYGVKSNKTLKCKFFVDDIINFLNNTHKKYDTIIMLSVDRWIFKNLGEKILDDLFKKIDDHCTHSFIFESRGRHLTYALQRMPEITSFNNNEVIGIDDGETKRKLIKFWR